MSMGMTWEQYWYGDVRMTQSFYDAYQLKKQEMNERLWLQGMYVYHALHAELSNFKNSLSGSRQTHQASYPDKPYELKARTEEEEKEEQETEEEKEVRLARAYMRQLDAVGKNWGKK